MKKAPESYMGNGGLLICITLVHSRRLPYLEELYRECYTFGQVQQHDGYNHLIK